MNPSFALRGVALAALLACTGAHAADDARLDELERQLRQSLQLINRLQARVQELEQRAPAAAVAAAPAPAPATLAAASADAATTERLEAIERTVNDMSVAAARPADNGVPLHGFVDVGLANSTRNKPAGEHNGFRLGTFDLYLTPQLGERVKGLLELAFEYDSDGSLAVDAERLQLGYTFSDALTVWGGRFHTPYGYWNTAYHHGAQIQTSLTRPRFLAFEDQGGILPAHSVGLWGTGRMRLDAGKLQYDAYVVNGDRINEGVLDFNAGGDDNHSHGVGFNVALRPAAFSNLTVGVHGLRQRVGGNDSTTLVTGEAQLQMLGTYAFLDTEQWEVLGEYYRFRNKDLSGATGTHGSWAGFLQAGYHLDERWTAYARTERTDLSTQDPYFTLQASGASYRRGVAGARFEVDPRTALKVEFDRLTDSANPLGAVNTLRTQYAVRF